MLKITFSGNLPQRIQDEIASKSRTNSIDQVAANRGWYVDDTCMYTEHDGYTYRLGNPVKEPYELIYIFNVITKTSMFIEHRYVGINSNSYPLSCNECSSKRMRSAEEVRFLIPPDSNGAIFYCEECYAKKRIYICDCCKRPHTLRAKHTVTDRWGGKHRFCSSMCRQMSGWNTCANCAETYSKEECAKQPGIKLSGNWYCTASCAHEKGWNQCDCEDKTWFIKRDEYTFCPVDQKHHCENCMPRQGQTRTVSINPRSLVIGKPSFGLELELSETPYQKYSKGWNTEWLRQNTPADWGIHGDGSVTSGYEAVTTPFQEIEQVRQTIEILKNYCAVNDSCGTHMHIGNFIDQQQTTRLIAMAVWSEPLWQMMCKKNRWWGNNSYCYQTTNTYWMPGGPGDAGIFSQMVGSGHREWSTRDRYRKINLQALTEWKTIENRAMEGTLNPGELEIWVKFWTWMWNQAKTQWSRPRNCCVRHFAVDTQMPTELMNEVLELIATKHTYEEIGSMKWCHKENWDVRIFRNQNMQNNEAWREAEDALVEHPKCRDKWAEIVRKNAEFNVRQGIDIIPASDYETSCTVIQRLAQEGII